MPYNKLHDRELSQPQLDPKCLLLHLQFTISFTVAISVGDLFIDGT